MFKSTRKFIAIAAIAASALCALPAAGASASTVVGTTFYGNSTSRMANVQVYAYRYTSSGWSSSFKIATSNSSGNYSAALVGGYYYQVRGLRSTSNCGPNYLFDGASPVFLLNPNATASATLRLQPINSWYVPC